MYQANVPRTTTTITIAIEAAKGILKQKISINMITMIKIKNQQTSWSWAFKREGKGENAHNRDTSRESHQRRRSHQEEQVLSTKFYNNWRQQNSQKNRQNNQVPDRQTYNNKTYEQSYNERYIKSKGRQQETYEPSRQPYNKSSIKITSINDPRVSYNNTPAIPSPRRENERFEDIAEANLTIIGDILISNTPQSQTISQSTVSDQEEALSRENATNTSTVVAPVLVVDTVTTATTIIESTRGESQSSLLGGKSHEVTIASILEEINKSSSSKSNNSIREEHTNEPGLNKTQSCEVELEGNLVINEQSTHDESQGSLLGEMSPEPPSDTPTNQQEEVTTTSAAWQNINSSELLIPREEFTLIEDHESLEEIVIYDMVVEYQSIKQYDGDTIETKEELKEKGTSEIVPGNVTRTPTAETNIETLESTTMSQVVIAREEEVLAQSFGEPSNEEIEEWTKILNNKADDEQLGRDDVHEEDMELITKDRSDPIPTNNDCISSIYCYEKADDPTIPTAIFYRYCKPLT